MEKLLNTKQLAEYFGVSESTIVQYRSELHSTDTNNIEPH